MENNKIKGIAREEESCEKRGNKAENKKNETEGMGDECRDKNCSWSAVVLPGMAGEIRRERRKEDRGEKSRDGK